MPVRNLPTKRTLSQKFEKYLVRSYDIKPVYCAHGRIINFFIFWRRNARSHTKYPISDKIIGTSVLFGVGWLRGSFGAGLGLDFGVDYFPRAGLGLAGVGIATCIYFQTITAGCWGAFGLGLGLLRTTLVEAVPLTRTAVSAAAAKLNAYRSRRKVKGACPVRAQRVCLYYEPP